MIRTALFLLTALLQFSSSCAGRKVAPSTKPATKCKQCPLHGEPVIGVDGFMYASACIAECQGVALAPARTKPHNCHFNQALRIKTGSVSKEAMHRYSKQGFRFVGKFRSVPQHTDDAAAVSEQATSPADKPSNPSDTPNDDPAMAVRMDMRDGNVYVQDSHPDTNNNDDESHSLEGYNPEKQKSKLRRSLQAIIGTDDRMRPEGTAYPLSAVVMIARGNRRGCTGAFIGPRTILTAAHCLYNTTTKAWYDRTTYNLWSDKSTKYTARVLSQTVLRGYLNGKGRNYDIGYIKLDEPLGEKLGWFGVTYSCGAYKYPWTTAGYPADLPWATRIVSKCEMLDRDACSERVLTHTCDTRPGQSGSPLFIANTTGGTPYIRGVHNSATPALNFGAWIRPEIWSFIKAARAD